MIGVRYVGALADTSGYGSAGRGYAGALLTTGEVDLTLEVVSFEQQRTTHGKLGERLRPYMDRKVDYSVQIVHLTPENFPRFHNPNVYNIGYAAWETDKLPVDWPGYCNLMDEIWVPSDYNVEVFKNSGVVKPVKKVIHGVELPDTTGITPLDIADPDVFVFGSIFQWTERKNPIGLLKSYLTEFTAGEKVHLALKTYRMNTSQAEQDTIKNTVAAVKRALNLSSYPPITFYGSLMPDEMIKAFHMRENCFVLPVRSEGFGLPMAEALAMGKPVISTRYGGVLEFLDDSNSYLVDYMMTPVYGMIFGNYDGSMSWAEPSIMGIRKVMRQAYENQDEAKAKGSKGQKDIASRFNWKVVGDVMINRLKQVVRK